MISSPSDHLCERVPGPHAEHGRGDFQLLGQPSREENSLFGHIPAVTIAQVPNAASAPAIDRH